MIVAPSHSARAMYKFCNLKCIKVNIFFRYTFIHTLSTGKIARIVTSPCQVGLNSCPLTTLTTSLYIIFPDKVTSKVYEACGISVWLLEVSRLSLRTECPKIYRKSGLHLFKYITQIHT